MPTRLQEFSKVRDHLDYPLAGRPNPHQIVSELMRQEQFQATRLSNTRRPWAIGGAPVSVSTVEGRAEYSITTDGFGKALFVYRELDSNILLPVPFADYLTEIHDQKYEFWTAPVEGGLSPNYRGDKVAFFRTKDGATKMRVYPVPEESGAVYKIVYALGYRDSSYDAPTDETLLPEFSDFRTIQAALFLLPKAEWDGLNRQEASEKRKELALSLQTQVVRYEAEFERYASNVQAEPPGEVGYWSE
ncbi:MAG TPA: hypothetical protein VIL74_09040 [Pyrinomonadaceae bacterium]|jgi:hypothetical protein